MLDYNLMYILQPRPQSSLAISDMTSTVKLVGKIRRGRLPLSRSVTEPPLVTRIARTGLGKRLVRALELDLQVLAPP